MCGLCGVLGGPAHWTDAAARPGVFTRNTDEAQRRRERRNRVAQAERVLRHGGVRIEDWQGASFILSNRTGSSELVDDLAHLWAAAERLSGRPCDPLDTGLIEMLEAAHAAGPR
jgi:hypothetical protein